MTVKQVPEHIAAIIRKDLPPPVAGGVRKAGTGKYEPVVWLGVGESFFVPGPKMQSVKTGCYQLLHRRKCLSYSLAFREEVLDGVDGFRVWRTK